MGGGTHLGPDADLSSRRDYGGGFLPHGHGKRVVDYGCGPGHYANRFSENGAEVTGIDVSSRLLDYARNEAVGRGLSADYVQSDYVAYQPDDVFDLAAMISWNFCVLQPEKRSTFLSHVQEAIGAEDDFYSM